LAYPKDSQRHPIVPWICQLQSTVHPELFENRYPTHETHKEKPWNWAKEQDEAFKTLKQACVEPPVLVSFRSNEPMRFETDASDLAIGMCAKQERNGKWHPIVYRSRKFTSAEENYDIHDKELLAIVVALEHWRVYAEAAQTSRYSQTIRISLISQRPNSSTDDR
jgi:hypothetical protein